MSIISLVIELWMMLIMSNEIKFLVSCCSVLLIKFLVAKNLNFLISICSSTPIVLTVLCAHMCVDI